MGGLGCYRHGESFKFVVLAQRNAYIALKFHGVELAKPYGGVFVLGGGCPIPRGFRVV